MKKLIMAMIAISIFSTARASFLVEPYLGMHFNSDIDRGADDDLSGIGMGARLGWQNLGLQLGVNYKTASFELDNANTDASYNHMGVFAGYEFPILVKVWAEYIISSEFDIDGGATYDEASGTTIGFGYTGLPFVSINFETTKISYDRVNSSNADMDLNTYMLSVSLPITL